MKTYQLLLSLLFLPFCLSLQAQTSKSIAEKYLLDSAAKNKLSAADLADWIVTDEHISSSSGIHHIYVRQRYEGIEVFSANASIHILQNGELLRVNNQFVSQLSSKVITSTPTVSVIQAVEAAAEQLEYKLTEPLRILEKPTGKEQKALLSKGGISLERIPAKLVYQPMGDGKLYLAWDISIYEIGAQNWWQLRVDATTGKILDKNNWVQNCDLDHSEHVFTSETPKASSHKHKHSFLPGSGPAYRVFPLPIESPSHGSRSLAMNPSNATASPYGWHDTDGAAGAEFTITRGNNTYTYEDINADNLPGYSPDGGAMLNFDFPLNFNTEPSAYQDAAITNLFYWNNIMHDVLYQYGFDETSGNFQFNNYGKGGIGNDAVNAEAQDGSGIGNANFGTPPDGFTPRMQMFLFNNVSETTTFEVLSPAGLAGTYAMRGANFGAKNYNVAGSLIEVNDGSANPSFGCNALVNAGAINGKIAFIDRGNCDFSTKALHAQNAGAIAVVICNNVPGIFAMGPGVSGNQVTIPALMLSQSDCATIRTSLVSPGVQVSISRQGATTNFITSDLDNGVIAHEYVHGLSTRLTGGASTSSCLSGEEQMGEGWSDWYAVMLTMDVNDMAEDARGIGTYLVGESTSDRGFRTYPYSTDMAVNPHTYNSIKTESIPHGVGSVWAAMLWEMSWALIDRYGFDPDFYNGKGGNNIALQLVTEALKLQPCNPGFVDGRDAILAADMALYNGKHHCLIWQAFAKRGLGHSASQGASASRSDGTEAFNPPPGVSSPCSITPDFLVTVTPLTTNACAAGTAQYEVTVLPANGYSSSVNLSVSGLPTGAMASFGSSTLNNLPASTTLTLFNLNAVPIGKHTFQLKGTKDALTHSVFPAVNIINATPPAPALQMPLNAATIVNSTPFFKWETVTDAIGYHIQIATSPTFANNSIVHQEALASNSYNAALLSAGTYYWRVNTITTCGTGSFSAARSFTLQSCNGLFTDSGGTSAPHDNMENVTYTICPDNPAGAIQIRFTAFDIEPTEDDLDCYDFLEVYDGNSTSGTFLGQFCGTGLSRAPGGGFIKANNPSGCLTFVFSSDQFVTHDGWEATVNCDFLLNVSPEEQQSCQGGSAQYKLWVAATSKFTTPVNLSAVGLPQDVGASFSPSTLTNFADTATLTLTFPPDIDEDLHVFQVQGTNNVITRSVFPRFEILSLTPPTLVTPANASSTINSQPIFSWNSVFNATGYTIQIATDAGFSNIVQTGTSSTTSYQANALSGGTTYYWRARADFGCGSSAFSATRSFSIQACGGTFVDSGGTNGNYSNNENITYTICPDNPWQAVSLNFTMLQIEPNGNNSCYDGLIAYQGASADAPLIGVFCGNQTGVITANNPSGCLTFVFISDNTITQAGWEAAISCVPQPQPTISIADGMVTEGDAGQTNLNLTVSLSNAYQSNVTVNYATVNNTATTQSGDYVAKQGTLTFQPGQVMKTISITINGDTQTEPDETFFVNLSASTNATIADGQGIATIQNDDGCIASITENSALSGTVVRQAANTITSSSVISPPADVTFVAGQSITLKTGFHAKAGVTFTARIQVCAQSAAPIVESREEEVENIWLASSPLELRVHPNPFSVQTNIWYKLPKAGGVTLTVHNVMGQVVQIIQNAQTQAAGEHTLTLDGSNLPGGIYYIRLNHAGALLTEKVIVAH